MPRLTKHPFTMIEILLALGVAAIGICSIMVLFPVAANASRDTAMETYGANAAEELLHYYQRQLQRTKENKWNDYIPDGATEEIPNSTDISNLTLTAGSNGKPQGWQKFSSNFPDLALIDVTGKSHVYLLANIAQRNIDCPKCNKSIPIPGLIIETKCPKCKEDITYTTDVADINWAAIIVITKHKINLNGSKSALDNQAIALQADVTWPAQADASNRKTVTYVLEVCKP